jgi:hypothetical protein
LNISLSAYKRSSAVISEQALLMRKLSHDISYKDEAKTIDANYQEKALALSSGAAKLNIWSNCHRFR